jgi:hypothetical protein
VLALVTTAPSGDPGEARDLASRFGLDSQSRAGRTLPELLRDAGGAPVFVLGRERAELLLAGERPARFRVALGLSELRLHRTLLGEEDPLVAAAGLRPGEAVLDATLGLGGDALLAAHVTGSPVVGLEASPVLAAFTALALGRPGGRGAPREAVARAGARVEVWRADHRTALAELPDGSFDVVLLDPMFRHPGASSALFALVRSQAEHAPLSAGTLRGARRVARRGVLVKDAAPGGELARLGLSPLPARRLPRLVFGWATGGAGPDGV